MNSRESSAILREHLPSLPDSLEPEPGGQSDPPSDSDYLVIKIPRDKVPQDNEVEAYKTVRDLAPIEVDRILLPPIMAEHNYNQSEVARILGLDRDTLRLRLKAIGWGSKAPPPS